MKNSFRGKLSVALASCCVAGLFLTGCQQEQPQPSASPTAVGTFTGQELPDEVASLEGTPLFSVSEELTALANQPNACYLLIAPQDPTKAVLVTEPGAKPADLGGRESKPSTLSGTKSTIKSEALIAHVKEQYDLDLQVDDAGLVVMLTVQPAPAAATATPAASEGE